MELKWLPKMAAAAAPTGRLSPLSLIHISIPAVYTNTNFWHDYIIQPNPGVDVSVFARYPLWLVDLQGNAVIPTPWTKANFVQNHFGENAPPGSCLLYTSRCV